MDEYYCPNCGAILNNQYGFDPDKGSWDCTECGQHLFDEETDNGVIFPGVAWYCDECGALLNKQPGFYDGCGYWNCTECYNSNSISENEIYKPEDDTNESEEESDENEPDDEENYFVNNYSYGDTKYPSTEYYSQASQNQSADTSYLRFRKSDKELRRKRIKAFLLNRKRVKIDYDCHELLGGNITEVKTKLHNQAFTNIVCIPVKDIYKDSEKKAGDVEQIVIDGVQFFNSQDLVSYDARIVITYHEKHEIEIPFSAVSLKKMNCLDVVDTLKKLGFTELYTKPIYDLVTGWFTKNGSVEKVTIAGDSNFKKKFTYKYDSQIVIEYHTKRSRR